MLFCPSCGSFLGASLEIEGKTIGVANGALLDDVKRLPATQIVSPKKLPPEEKRTRWLSIWAPTEVIISD